MSATPKTSPAPFDARHLAETLDTMGLLVASLSDRIDAQGRMLEQVLQTATEARAAAFAAEKATNWEHNGDLIDKGIARESRHVDELVATMDGQLKVTGDVFETVQEVFALIRPRERERQERMERQGRWMPAYLAGAVVVGIALTLLGIHIVGWG